MFGKNAKKGYYMYLRYFNFNFWHQLGDSLYYFFKSLWEIFSLLIIFVIVWGIVCVPFLILYFLITGILKPIFKIEIDFLKYFTFVPVLSFISTVLLLIFIL